MLIEHHLEEILNNNKPAVTAAIRAEIGNAMKTQNRRKKARMKKQLHSDILTVRKYVNCRRSSLADHKCVYLCFLFWWKQQEKLNSAAEVILGSTLSIVSCSSNMDFRNACFNLMKVLKTWSQNNIHYSLFVFRPKILVSKRKKNHVLCVIWCDFQVTDSHALSSRLSESLRGVMSWRFLPVSRCYSTQVSEACVSHNRLGF